MLHDIVDEPDEHTETELLALQTDQLAAVIQAVGVEPASAAARQPEAILEAVAAGDTAVAADLDVETVAAVLALADEAPPSEDIVTRAREALLFGMTAGVLNVDVVAAEVSPDLEPREVQGMLEGRLPMTLGEYVAFQRVVGGRAP